MKRALAIAVAVCTLGVAGFSQIGPITGSWTATVGLLPTVSLTSTLTLNYTVAGFTITSVSGFGTTGFTSQRFALRGAFGPFTMTGNMWFAVAPPAYTASDLTGSFDFGGIAITGVVRHWVTNGWQTGWGTAPANCPEEGQTGALQYILTTVVSPITVRARFLDCSFGTEFQDLLVTLRGLELCCGISYGVDFSFTKAGFDYIELSGLSIPIGLGVSFDVVVRYTVTAKTVTLTPRIADIAACLSVWFSPVVREGATRFWEGIELDGYSIRCALGDCNYLEYVHIFDRTGIPTAVLDKFSATLHENEYLELGFCGPGCCGGRWALTLRALWSTTTGTHSGLFGLTRFVGSARIPLMTTFTLNLDAIVPAVTGPATFSIGWTFTF